jgi:hypothetical protein
MLDAYGVLVDSPPERTDRVSLDGLTGERLERRPR